MNYINKEQAERHSRIFRTQLENLKNAGVAKKLQYPIWKMLVEAEAYICGVSVGESIGK
jgi:hypothetical protein